MSTNSERGRRYSDTERALIATVLADLGFTGTQNLLSGTAPTYPTLRKIAEEYNVTVPQGKRGRKPGSTVEVAETTNSEPASKRGRRYDGVERAKLVTLIEEHGLTGTMKVLGDDSPSIVTLHKIAKDAGVELTRGRPALNEAEAA